MTFARRVFLVAAIYGLIVLVPQYVLGEKTGRDFPPPITVQGRLSGQMLGAGLLDLVLGLLFIVAYTRTPTASSYEGML
jgi:glycerol uptake facilitator-like aquaporin